MTTLVLVLVCTALASIAAYGAVFGRRQTDADTYDRESARRLRAEIHRHEVEQ